MPFTMLIVDDSRVSRMMLRAYFVEQRPTWHYLEAANGLEAIDLAQQHVLQLVSMDLNMPGMDGLEAGAQIKAQQPNCCIVLLTANIQSSTQERALAAGLHFIPKPITADTVSKILTVAGA
ncbi:response regulator transcription factor [Deefgea rivuli]|uniref:response regulator transcription factor n=1 Tax=Deefgea rivuli TaxID=400948 RepID=UPI000486B9DB|nr:response regulator [Deefgea rivuli]